MYNSELGRRLRHQSSGVSLNGSSSDRRGSTSAPTSTSKERRSPTRALRSNADLLDPQAHSLAIGDSSSADNYTTTSQFDAFAAHLSASPMSREHSNPSHSSSWNGTDGDGGAFASSSSAASTSALRPDSPRRRPVTLDRPRTPSKRGSIQADRYVPTRQDSNEQTAAFQLLPGQPTTPHRQKRKMAPDVDAEKEEADHTFANLLGAEIFGRENHAAATAASMPHSSSLPSTASGSGAGGGSGGNAVAGPSGSRPSSTAPSTPTKRNLFTYSSPSSSRSRSGGASGGRGSSSSSSSTSRRAYAADDTMRADRTLVEAGNGLAASSAPGGISSPLTTPRRRGDPSSGGNGLFGSGKRNSAFDSDDVDSPLHRAYDTSPVKTESQRLLLSPRRAPRSISKVPFKVLDAPDLADDFYLNLVDWSSSNTLAVGLSKSVYLWSARDSKVQQLVDLDKDGDKVASVSWAGRGHHLAIGTHRGNVQIWDAETLKLLRTMRGHSMRVGALAWNEHILTSGARDRIIYHRDVRVPEQHIRELNGHKQEVCNLEWNTETNQLASGGNDNKLLVWDSLNTTPLYRFSEHQAAVKAIAWSPHQQGILASGGGTADMKIRFWNTITGSLLSEVDTGSQVCNLMWSRTSNEIISTHGYSAGKIQNQIQIWRYPTMQQVATLTGHTMRVLYLAMSPDGETIVTGAGDETLRFWDLNTPSKGNLSREAGTGAAAAAAASSSSLHGVSAASGTLNPFAKLR